MLFNLDQFVLSLIQVNKYLGSITKQLVFIDSAGYLEHLNDDLRCLVLNFYVKAIDELLTWTFGSIYVQMGDPIFMKMGGSAMMDPLEENELLCLCFCMPTPFRGEYFQSSPSFRRSKLCIAIATQSDVLYDFE